MRSRQCLETILATLAEAAAVAVGAVAAVFAAGGTGPPAGAGRAAGPEPHSLPNRDYFARGDESTPQ